MRKQITTFYIVRHGETEFNVKGIMQGNVVDSSLTKKGEEQARNIAKELFRIHFDHAFSSDLLRAKRTADIITLEKKLAVKTTQALREQSYGRHEGKPIKTFERELKKLFEIYEKLTDDKKMNFHFEKGMETDAQTVYRFLTFLREIAIAYRGKNILVVSHGDAIKYFLIHIGFATYEELSGDAIENCSYVKVQSDGIDFFVKETRGIHKKD